MWVQVAPFSFMQVKPIGVLQMLDQGERDDKIIAVHCHDPAFRNFNDISELPAHRLLEIRNFFQDYKLNENKVGRQTIMGPFFGQVSAFLDLNQR